MKEELENLSETDRKLCRMLAGLERVEAPKDFDFHLKARIAKADPRAYRKSSAGRLGYLVPAAGLAAVLALAGFYGNFSGGENTPINAESVTAPFESVQPQSPLTKQFAQISNANSNSFESNSAPTVAVQRISNLPSDENEAKRTDDGRRIERRSSKPDSNTSQVRASTVPPVIGPRGIDPDKRVEIPESEVEEKDFEAQSLLNTLGVETVLENGSIKIKSLPQNSPAARFGLKSGDVIESINDQKISNGKIRGKRVDMKKIGVKRGAETVQIDLQVKSQQ